MKKINLFSMAAAFLLAATSCSDDIDNGGNKPGEPIDGNGVYLSVNIMTPSTSGAYTKAGEEGTTSSKPSGGETGDNFLSALEKENTVSGVTIVLYGNKETTDVNKVKTFDINTEDMWVIASSYTSSVIDEKTDNKYDHYTGKKATVRLNSEDLKPNTYYRILAIANANVASSFPAGEKLANCKIKPIENNLDGTAGTFIMSTHVEKNTPTAAGSTEEHSIVSFTNENIKENTPATGTVWVERLSARIDYVGTTFEFPVKETGTENVIAKVELQGVAPVNVATHNMYIFKQVADAADAATFTTLGNEEYTSGTEANYVIEPTTNTPNSKVFSNPFNNSIIATINKATGQLGFKNFTGDFWKTTPSTTATDENRIICYTGENTMAYNQQTHGNTTGVIFKAKYDPESLLVYNETDGTDLGQVAPENKPSGGFTTGFYRVNNKLYKELEAAEAELIISGTDLESNSPLAWLRKNFTKTTTWGDLPTGTDFEAFKSAVATAAIGKNDLGYLKFLNDKLSATGVTAVDATTMNWAAFLDKNTALQKTDANWKMSSLSSNEIQTIEYFDASHTCYYPYWIRHANNGDNDVMGIMEFCIVRNNVYRLNVTGIDGLGMADPFDSTDKPDEGEEEGYYLKVELYVHDWVVRDNGSIILKPGN